MISNNNLSTNSVTNIKIVDNTIEYSKIQNISTANYLLESTSSSGNVSEG